MIKETKEVKKLLKSLYEFRRGLRKVKFCYACRLLKSINEYYQYKRKESPYFKCKKRYVKTTHICKICHRIVTKKKYQIITGY